MFASSLSCGVPWFCPASCGAVLSVAFYIKLYNITNFDLSDV